MKNVLVKGGDRVGALAGYALDTTIASSWSTGSVYGDRLVGGLIGIIQHGNVIASYSLASVTATNTGGGLVGNLFGSWSRKSYAGGEVNVSGVNRGGLAGDYDAALGTSSHNYYNTDTTTLSTSPVGTGKTDAELRVPTGYTGIYQHWNVDVDNADGDNNLTTGTDDPWSIVAGRYPVLKYGAGASIAEQVAAQLTVASGSTAADLSALALSAGSLSPTFARDTAAYTATIPATTTSLTFTPTAVTSEHLSPLMAPPPPPAARFQSPFPRRARVRISASSSLPSGMIRIYNVVVTRLQDYDDDDDGLIDIRTHQQLTLSAGT